MIEKPIKGAQLTPNNLQEECVRVQKVYDWVVDVVSRDDSIDVPDDCQAAIDALPETSFPLDVTCTPPEVPGTFPLIPKPQPDPEGDAFCVISSNIERRTVNVGGVDVELAIIKAVFRIMPTVTVTDVDGNVVCEFTPTITLSKRLAVCLPEPLTRDNILCRITQVTCDENFLEDAPGGDLDLQLDITVCFEIQVEAEVKLEILAKFCQPRPNDIDISSDIICPTFDFPEQCPTVFPRQNCDCQAFVSATNQDVPVTFNTTYFPNFVATPTPNSTTLNATICDDCTLGGSTLSYIFRDLREDPTVNQSFTFMATEFNFPECLTPPGTDIAMIVTGQGMVQYTDAATPDQQVRFTLALNEFPGMMNDSYTFRLFDGATMIYTSGNVTVPDTALTVQDCVTFGDVTTITRP